MEAAPLVHLTPNLIMNARMMEAAYARRVQKLLFISSNTVYPQTDHPVREDEVTNEFFEKYFIVGWMKRFSEIITKVRTISSNSRAIEDTAQALKTEMESRLSKIATLIHRVNPAQTSDTFANEIVEE